MRGDPDTEATEDTGNDSVLKKLDQNQQLSQGGTAPWTRQVTAARARLDKPVGTPSLQWTTALSLSRSFHRARLFLPCSTEGSPMSPR